MPPRGTIPSELASAAEPSGGGQADPRPTRPRRLRGMLTFAAKLVLTVGLLGWLVASGRLDLSRLATVPFSSSIVFIVVCLVASMFLQAVRWQWLLEVQRISAPLGEVVRFSWIGYYAATFLPGGAGGDVAKAYLIARDRTSGRTRAVSTVLVDRFIGLYSLLLLGCGSFVWLGLGGEFGPAILSIAAFTLALTLAMTAAPLFLVWRPIRSLLRPLVPRAFWNSLYDSWVLYRGNKRAVAKCLLLSLVSNSLVMLSLAASADALELGVPTARIFLAGPIIILANSLPFTPGGAGVGEVAGERLFSLLGLAGGAETMLLQRIFLVLLSLPGGLLLLARKRTHDPANRQNGSRARNDADAPESSAVKS
jgi:uncharacterized membrane protein YbhN (UPF0104 family)